MDKKLEKMRSEMRAGLRRGVAFAGLLVVLIGLSTARVVPVRLPHTEVADFVTGFQVGLLCGLLAMALAGIFRCRRALRDDAALRKLYYQEHDERNIYIQQKVGRASMAATPVLLLTAAVIAGYFSAAVFFSLIGATLLHSLVGLGLKLYYHRQFSGAEE